LQAAKAEVEKAYNKLLAIIATKAPDDPMRCVELGLQHPGLRPGLC
jgi:hypothetical protein